MRSLLKSGLRRLVDAAAPSKPTRPLGDKRATVLAVATQKGGVGKTTTSVALAAGLARFHGKRVLLVDLDPQGHVTTSLRAQVRLGGGPLSEVLGHEGSELDLMDVIAPTEIERLDVTPYDPQLAQAEDLLGARIGKELVLRDALAAARTWYDVIVLDCPPNLGNLSVNALVAADQVLVPCDPSPLAVNGVHALVRTIGAVASRLNPNLDVLGVLLTRVDGRNTQLNQAVIDDITQTWGDALIPVQIGINAGLARAQHEGTDVFSFDPDGRGARQYRELSDWVAGRLAGGAA